MAINYDKVQIKLDIDTEAGLREISALQEKLDTLKKSAKTGNSSDERAKAAKEANETQKLLDAEREKLGLLGMTLNELKSYYSQLAIQRRSFTQGTEQYKQIDGQMAILGSRIKEITSAQYQYQAKIRETVESQGLEKLTLTELREYYKLLQKEIENTADLESETSQKRIADSKKTEQLIADKEATVNGTKGLFNTIKSKFPAEISGAVGGLFAGVGQQITETIINGVSNAIDAVKKESRKVTEIQVALDTTRTEAKKLDDDLYNIKTDTAVEELEKLVIVAGDINVATKEMKSFVDVGDQVGKVFGEDFGSVENAVTELAKLKGEFKETRDMMDTESMQKVGSVVKQLNLDGPASTKGITDFLKRTGQLPDALKPTIAELAAYAAVFEEANITAEISSGGFSKIITTAANNLDVFAKQMKISKNELADLINEKPNEFFIKFAESMKGLNGTQTSQTLKNVKLDSDEVKKVVGVLTDNIDKLKDKQLIANQAFQDGQTVHKIASQYMNDEAGQIAMIEKAWDKVTHTMTNWLIKVSGPLITSLADIATSGKDLTTAYSEQQKTVANLTTTIAPAIDRYEALKKKSKELGGDTKLTTKDQQDLHTVLGQLQTSLPATALQFDNYGKVIGVNTQKARDFILVQKAMLKAQNADLIRETEKTLKEQEEKINKDLPKNFKQVKDRTGKDAFVRTNKTLSDAAFSNSTLTPEEYAKKMEDLGELQKSAEESRLALKGLKGDLLEIPTLPPPPKPDLGNGSGNGSGTGTGTGNTLSDKEKAKQEKEKQEAIEAKKLLQENTEREIKLRAKLAYEADQALANEEEKKIQQLTYNAEKEQAQIRQQFKDKDGLIIEYSKLSISQKNIVDLEEKSLDERLRQEVLATRAEFEKKRQEQIREQLDKAIQLANQAKSITLDNNLQVAEKSGDSNAIFWAKEAILANNRDKELADTHSHYLKKKEELAGNDAALLELEKNYQTERNNIATKYDNDYLKILDTTSEQAIQRTKKANIDKLALDVKEAQATKHGDVLGAQKALLFAQMQEELSVKGLTEQEKTNITRRYTLEREALEKGSNQAIAAKAIATFNQAFSGITSAFKQDLANRESAENDKYTSSTAKIDAQEKAGTISAAKATAEKTKLEKAHTKEVAKLRYEQAKIDKANNIVQATINGVQATMKAYAELGPIFGPIAAVVLGAISAYSVAKIAAQPLPEANLYSGGALPDTFQNPVDEKGGGLIIGHPGEYMIPRWIRRQPIFANIEPVIDNMITSGKSYEKGGAINNVPNFTAPAPTVAQDNSLLVAVLQNNIEVQKEMMVRLQNIEVIVGYEAAEKILDTANQVKSIKQSARA